MSSPTQWTWVWVNSGSWWWTGRPGVLRFMGLQRVGDDWATELNWTVPVNYFYCVYLVSVWPALLSFSCLPSFPLSSFGGCSFFPSAALGEIIKYSQNLLWPHLTGVEMYSYQNPIITFLWGCKTGSLKKESDSWWYKPPYVSFSNSLGLCSCYEKKQYWYSLKRKGRKEREMQRECWWESLSYEGSGDWL